jgi:5'-nucleotidase/UDP-sugar diphosphatase
MDKKRAWIWRWLSPFTMLAVLLSMAPGVTHAATAPAAPAQSQQLAEPVASLSGRGQDWTGRTPPAHLQEVPPEIQELFANGMTAEEFVQMAGYVPHALEGLVDGEALMIIELEGDPVAVAYAAQRDAGRSMTSAGIESYRQTLMAAQDQLEPQLERLGVKVISRYNVVYNGFQARVPLSRLNEIRALPGVVAIHRAPIHEPALSSSVPLIGASRVLDELGYDGEGVVIAIIDTGIDYTHAVFGGSGDPDDFANNDPDIIEPGTFPTAKVIGGYDFAGTLYNAACTPQQEAQGICSTTPTPDRDPLDEYGHGTHVASIAAGMAAGSVSHGVAPAARLLALKVFGRSGSTSLVMDALEFATFSYLMYGYPQVINMSLGSNFGTNNPADPDVYATNNAAQAGIVVVASAGNAANSSYITGSPASADGAISVAASEDGYSLLDGFEVITPTDIAGVHPALQSANYNWNSPALPITGTLVYPDPGPNPAQNQRTGCYPFNITNTQMISGNIVLLDWNTPSCGGSVARSANAVAAGAIGVIIVDDSAVFDLYIAGSAVVPAYSIPLPIGDLLKDALEGGTVEVVMTAEHQGSVPYDEPAAVDIIASFSSRGPRGYDSALKPEITAPGGSIFAADMGSGSGGVSLNGTSMAAPHIAGVAALMVQAHPDWTPEAIKAAMMNTAVDLRDGTPIPRSGAGRVNAYRAVDTDVYAVGDDSLVSLNWGVIMSADDTVTRVSHVTVYNDGDSEVTYGTGWMFQPGSLTGGATITVEPDTITLAPGETAVVTVTLDVDMTAMEVLYDATALEEYYGFVTFTPPTPYQVFLPLVAGGTATAASVEGTAQLTSLLFPEDALRVPFYFQPRPYAVLEISGSGVITDPETDIATFAITHTGPISSSLWVYPALVEDGPDAGMYGPGDVRVFGLDYGWTSGTYGDIIVAAIDAWDYWHVPQPYFAEFDLYVDYNENGVWDYVDFNWNYGAAAGGTNNNQWVVIRVNLATGALSLASPYLIYTDYNNSYMEWYLRASTQGLGSSNPTFDYQLIGFDEGGADETAPGRFDYVNYPFGWDVTNDPGPAEPAAEVWVWVNDQAGYYYSQPLGVMIVDYNGDPANVEGTEAYFEPITVPGLNVLDLTLLHTNDFHAHVDQYNVSGARCKPADETAGNCIAGVSRLATLIEGIRAERENVLLLDAGDQFQGTLFFNLFGADVLTDTMNSLGYDAMTIGNHEFDRGPAELARFIGGAGFPVVSANIDASADPDLAGLIDPYVILDVNGQDVGIVGLTTPETENISSPGPNITFTNPITAVQTAVDELTALGVDRIVVLSHLGYGEDLALAAAVSGVDVIIGGHSHTFLYTPVAPTSFTPPTLNLTPLGPYPTFVSGADDEPVLVVSAYQWGTFLGRLDVVFDADGTVQYYNRLPIYVNRNVAKDPAMEARLDVYRPAVAALIATPVGTTTVALPINVSGVRICRKGECLLGNLVADAMLWMANEANPSTTYQIAFQNGGGLRAPIMTGTVTMGDVLETLPFGNTLATFQLQGQYVIQALENGARLYPSENGGFAQVAGLRYTINASQPAWSRISNVEVWNGSAWEALDPDAYYYVVTNNFMRQGGDNYLVFRDHAINPYDYGPALDEALAEYFRTFSPVTPVIEGRITINP